MPFLAVFRVQARYWRRHKLQALLAFTGIVLGVAVFSAIQLANRGALAAFRQGLDDLTGPATHRIYSPAGTGVPEGVFPRLVATPGVEAAAPFRTARVTLPAHGGEVLTVLGVDPLSDGPFRPFRFVPEPGDAPAPEAGRALLERFLAEPGTVLVSRGVAQRLGVRAGRRLEVMAAGQRRTFTVLGVFRLPARREGVFGGTLIADLATHQEAFGGPGKLDAIDLILAPDAEAAVRALLPPGVALERAGRRADRAETIAAAFQLNLEALGLFALLVALFLIFNAATFSVVQRGPTLALLRCLGALAPWIFAALVAEAALAGALGGALGVLAGRGLALLMVRGTSATLFEVLLETEGPAAAVHLDAATWATGVGLGLAVAVVGALQPALEGARVSPLGALRFARAMAPPRSRVGLWSAGAVLCLGTAAALVLPDDGSLWGGLAGATLLATGGALLSPLALAVFSLAVTPLLGRLGGVTGRLAGRQLGRSLTRSGVATAALMLALALALAIEVTVLSFRATFELWMAQTVTADLYMVTPEAEGAPPFPPRLAEALRRAPFVRQYGELRTRRVVLEGRRPVRVQALDVEAFARTTTLPVRDGSREAALVRVQAGGALISETVVWPLGLRVGDALRLPTAAGEVAVPVAGVVQNYSAPGGVVYLARDRYEAFYGPEAPRRAAVWLADGVDPEAARRAIRALPGGADIGITSNAVLRAQSLQVFERTFAITHLMGSLAAFIAFVAVVSALMALLEERRRSLGFLRAMGLSRRRVGGSLALEAGLLALTATVMSWGLGVLMSAVLIFVVNRRAFGWTLQFHPGAGSYGLLLLLALGAALAGSLYPIYRATRLSVAATIREE